MKISLAQLNYHIGNFEKNRDLIVNSIRKAKSVGSDLIVFSELCIPGYPPLDLLDRLDFIEKCNRTLEEIALECKGIAAIVGCPTINPNPQGKKLYNSALVLQDGKVIFRTNKALLPTYDIFDEYRYFEPEKSFRTFVFKGVRIALAICEDLWDEQPFDNEFEKSRLYTVSPVEELSKERPDIIISISASPFAYNKIEAKENIFRKKAVKYRIPVISVNQTGANTELIFDGASLVMNREGELVRKLPFFEEALETISLEEINSGKISYSHQKPEVISLVHKALLTGLSDYLSKTGFRSCILGLSGGIDSAVVCCLAAEALGIDNVNALLLPSRYSSEHSVTDSIALAKNLGIKYEVISIEKPFTAFEELVKPFFAGKEPDVTEENIQSRTRAVILMAFANKFGHILLNTSNKSETAVGYGTLYGDM
ncbi:MAG: NAD(+) synthase, partial [Bacteroidales bacterium]|nr:NAD(+) synthase [Bacteroidales bacterium]